MMVLWKRSGALLSSDLATLMAPLRRHRGPDAQKSDPPRLIQGNSEGLLASAQSGLRPSSVGARGALPRRWASRRDAHVSTRRPDLSSWRRAPPAPMRRARTEPFLVDGRRPASAPPSTGLDNSGWRHQLSGCRDGRCPARSRGVGRCLRGRGWHRARVRGGRGRDQVLKTRLSISEDARQSLADRTFRRWQHRMVTS